jgi:hypothetical protein
MQTLICMSKDEVLKRLAEITGKGDGDVKSQGDNTPADIDNNKEETVGNASETRSDNSESIADSTTPSASPLLEEFKKIFGGNVVNEYLLDGRQMTKKEYAQYCKGLTQAELLGHPLLYMLFRAEDQSQVNFFEWLNKFKK